MNKKGSKILFSISAVIAAASAFFILSLAHLYQTRSVIQVTEIKGDNSFIKKVLRELSFIENEIHQKVFLSPGRYSIIIDHRNIINDESIEEDDYAYADISENECTIVMNKKIKWDEKKFRLVLMHEIGHCLGLDHPKNDNGSVMDARLSDETIEDQYQDIPKFLKLIKSKTKSRIICDLLSSYGIKDPILTIVDPFELCLRNEEKKQAVTPPNP